MVVVGFCLFVYDNEVFQKVELLDVSIICVCLDRGIVYWFWVTPLGMVLG